MDDFDLVKEKLAGTPISGLYALAQESGVPYGTLWNLKKKKTKNPSYPTVKALAAHWKQPTELA